MISIKDETIIDNLYDEDDPNRVALFNYFKYVLSRLKNKGYKCLATYTAGISIDFCRACAELDMLETVYIQYKYNDKKWPIPYKKSSKIIIKKASAVKTLSKGGFNTKKIKQVQEIIDLNSKITLAIEKRQHGTFLVTINSNES